MTQKHKIDLQYDYFIVVIKKQSTQWNTLITTINTNIFLQKN